MRPKLLLLLAFAMFGGIVIAKCTALILNVTPVEVQTASASVPMVTVLAVNDDVPAGKKIPIENIIMHRVPEENVPFDAVTSFLDISNSILQKKVTKGDVLFQHQFSQNQESQKEVFVPPGHQIVTVQVHGESRKDFGEFQKIQSGDRVDIQLVKKENRHAKTKEVVTTILENIIILNTQTEYSLDRDQQHARNKVSLLLNDDQVAVVHESQDDGKLRLFVRSAPQTVQVKQNDLPSHPVSKISNEDTPASVAVVEQVQKKAIDFQEYVQMGFDPLPEPSPKPFEALAASVGESYTGRYTPEITVESPKQSLSRPGHTRKYSSFYDSGQSAGWSANPYY